MSYNPSPQRELTQEQLAARRKPVSDEDLRRAKQTAKEARTQLIMGEPFFGVLLLKLKIVFTTRFPVCAVDGVHLYVNPNWILETPMPKIRGVFCHEVMHLAMGHHARQGTRRHDLFNVAADFAINGELIKAGMDLPDERLHDVRFDNKSTEVVYLTIEAEQPKPQPGEPPQSDGKQKTDGQPTQEGNDQEEGGRAEGDDDGPPGDSYGGCGEVLPAPRADGKVGPATEADLKASERDWEAAVNEATIAAKSAGKMPGWIERSVVEAVRNPKADWRTLMRRFFDDRAISEVSWQRPNRRFIWDDLYLPGTKGTGMGEIVIAVDTSGSISGPILSAFQNELNAILEDVSPASVHVVYCDAQIAHTETIEGDDLPVQLHPRGGGGTAFKPVFDWVEENQINPKAMIYLTDLMSGDLAQLIEPAYPVLWAEYGGSPNYRAPFGETIKID